MLVDIQILDPRYELLVALLENCQIKQCFVKLRLVSALLQDKLFHLGLELLYR